MDLGNKIISIIKETVDFDDEIKAEDNLKDLGIDSLKSAIIVTSIEEECNIEFDLSELDPKKLNKIKDLIDLTSKYV